MQAPRKASFPADLIWNLSTGPLLLRRKGSSIFSSPHPFCLKTQSSNRLVTMTEVHCPNLWEVHRRSVRGHPPRLRLPQGFVGMNKRCICRRVTMLEMLPSPPEAAEHWTHRYSRREVPHQGRQSAYRRVTKTRCAGSADFRPPILTGPPNHQHLQEE